MKFDYIFLDLNSSRNNAVNIKKPVYTKVPY